MIRGKLTLYPCTMNGHKPNKTMTPTFKKTIATALTLAIALLVFPAKSQERFTQTGTSSLIIAGTSTIHDWTMVTKEASFDVEILTNEQGEPLKINYLRLTLPAESLKSGKNAMDKNAYTALKTDKHKQISFQLTSARVEGKTINCEGKLTISGITNAVDIQVTYTVLPGGKLQCKGSRKIKMTDFNVEPPTFMFGSVTTGDEITVSFNVVLSPKSIQPVTLN